MWKNELSGLTVLVRMGEVSAARRALVAAPFLRMGRLTVLRKPNGRVRGIVTG